MAVLEVRGLTKRFGDRTACNDVHFSIEAGETYGLLGPNGAGKTTCIQMISGLLGPDGGTATIAGHDIETDTMAAKRCIGLVPQDLALYPDLSARENLMFFGRLHSLTGSHLRAQVDRCLDIVGLTDRADDRIEDFSGGMKRRANIGAGLLHDPSLLVLDEPTVGVDPQSRNAILATVDELGGAGLAVLYTTHYMEEAERLCDRIGIIDDGDLIAEGTRAELVARASQHGRIRVRTSGAPSDIAPRLRAIDGVIEVSAALDSIDILVRDAGTTLAAVAAVVGPDVTGIDVDDPDLEAVFLHLTGKALRD